MAQKPATTRIPPQLLRSDVAGKGAAEIGWGSPGDFDRCRAFARAHGVPGHMIDGFCANLHRIATGEWPGRNAHKGAHSLALDYLIASAGPSTDQMIRWEGPLAVVGEPTGDRRRFPHDTLKFQSFPMPFRFQRQGLAGHQGAVTVGVIENAKEQLYSGTSKELAGKRVVWGQGYFLDPKIVPEVNEAIHLAEHGVSGPSVDLDSYTAVLKKNALSGETTADMVRGRQRAATLVSVPAFADLRITVVRPKALTASSDTSDAAEFAAHPGGWSKAPIAPREAVFDADDAAKRIEAWANGDPDKMASMFLWIADSPNSPLIGRRGYRLPWGDIIDNKPYVIFHAVYAAAALLQGAHGGLPNIPDDEKGKLRSIVSEIYQKLAEEYDDASLVAPWDHQDVQQASGEPDFDVAYAAALEEFVRTNWRHRYDERKHPRDQRKDTHAGEWIDTPHGPHGQIKVGNKWVYPPKRGEKGYRNPEAAVRAKAKKGAGKSGGATQVAKKKPAPSHPAPAARRSHPESAQDHIDQLRGRDRQAQKTYLHDLNDEEINALVSKLNGSRLEDDTRDDLETEIIRRLGKSNDAEERQRRQDERTKEKDRLVREVSHGDEKKTIVAKKKEPERKAPQKKATQKADAGDREELTQRRKELKQIDNMLVESSDKGQGGSKRHEELLAERKTLLSDIADLEKRTGAKKAPVKKAVAKAPEKAPETSDKTSLGERITLRLARDRQAGGVVKSELHSPDAKKSLDDLAQRGLLDVRFRRYFINDKGRNALKGHESEEPETKAPEVKAPQSKKVTVAKKTGEAKQYTPNAAQQKALEDIRNGGKGHPGSRKVLQREGYIDENGQLTQKGRDHLGVKGDETKTPEVKAPEKKVTVGKKAPLTGAEIRDKLAGMKTRAEADEFLKSVRGKQLTDLENELGTGHSGLVAQRRQRIAESVEGVRKSGEGEVTSQLRKAAAVKKTPAERDDEKVAEALKQYRSLKDEQGLHKVLEGLSRRHLEKIVKAEGVEVHRSDTAGSLRQYLFRIKVHEGQSDKYRQEHRERTARLERTAKRREADYAARATGGSRMFHPNITGSAWWQQITEDTGPDGVHAVDVDITPNAGHKYVMASGTLYRRNGVSYLIEDGDDMLAPSDVAEQFDRLHASLPAELAHHQKAYVWVRGRNPADSYWEQHYKMPGFTSLATAGDGSVRVWNRRGDTSGPHVHDDELRHEFGHSVSYGIGRERGQTPLHDSPQWRDAAERDMRSRKLTSRDLRWAAPYEGGSRIQPTFEPGNPEKKGFPIGITDYGQNSKSEDFAEAVSLYTHQGPLAFTAEGHKPLYFTDLFPERAKILAQILPQQAAAQRKLIAARGPL